MPIYPYREEMSGVHHVERSPSVTMGSRTILSLSMIQRCLSGPFFSARQPFVLWSGRFINRTDLDCGFPQASLCSRRASGSPILGVIIEGCQYRYDAEPLRFFFPYGHQVVRKTIQNHDSFPVCNSPNRVRNRLVGTGTFPHLGVVMVSPNKRARRPVQDALLPPRPLGVSDAGQFVTSKTLGIMRIRSWPG